MEKIKIYTGMDEWNKVHYFKEFEIVYSLPEIGEKYDGQYKVIKINELKKDCEQGNDEAYMYDIYEVIAEDILEEGDEDYYDYRYLAVEKNNN